jgi:hypothetical protein
MAARYTNHMEEFTEEVLFQVGERVKVIIAPDVIPADEVKCWTGVVRTIKTKFMLTANMRKFIYEVWLDGFYHNYWNKSTVVVNQEQLEKVEV